MKSTNNRKNELIAVYKQQSNDTDEEISLLQSISIREIYLDKLIKIIENVRYRRRVCDHQCIYETIVLINQLRSSTIHVINNISIWQRKYTTMTRPIVMNCDYIKKRIIEIMKFMNSSAICQILNLQLGQGNFLFLPMFNKQRTIQPVEISNKLMNEINIFANPNRDDIIMCYHVLINSLSSSYYNNKVFVMKLWFDNPWIPIVQVNPILDQTSTDESKDNLNITTPTIKIKSNKTDNNKEIVKSVNTSIKLPIIKTKQTINNNTLIHQINDSILYNKQKIKENEISLHGEGAAVPVSTTQLRDWYMTVLP